MNRYAIVLAAGKGTRMKSLREDVSKVSFPILGKPLVKYVVDALKPLGLEELITIVGFGGETTKKIVENDSKVVWQKEQKGTGHAVMQAAPLLENKDGLTIICCGDTPLLKAKTLEALLSSHETNGNALTILTAVVDDPHGYGRIVKEGNRVTRIVEQKDCTKEQDLIKEINSGVYVFDNRELFKDLKKLTPNNAQGEYYLTDVIAMFVEDGLKVSTFALSKIEETMGINDRYQLGKAAKMMQHRLNKRYMLAGVSIEDETCTYIAPDTPIGQDTVIKPGTHIYGNSKIGKGCVIGPNAYLENVVLEDGAVVGPNEVIKK